MASTAADIIASAKAEAEAARQSAIANLSGLGTDLSNAYTAQQEATKAQYQNTLNQLQNAYQANVKSAYGNYMTDKQYLNNQLNRLGLQNTGYGVSQGLLASSAYSKNLAGLQNAYATNLGNLGAGEQQALADLYSGYAKNKLSLDQYLYEAGQGAYDTAYKNAYNAQQDAISNALQQQYYNYLYSNRSSGGSSGGYEIGLSDDGTFQTEYYKGNIPQNIQTDSKTYGTFSNGYQPKGISGHGTLSASKTDGKKDTITFNTQTLSGKKQTVTQNVWVAQDGTKWYWDGRDMQYHQIG